MPRALALPLVLLMSLPACQRATPHWRDVDLQSEADGSCSDGVDNDGDGAIDCVDSDCEADCRADNRAPLAPVVTITPADPTTDDDLRCTAISEDPEGDPLTYSYVWSMGGVFEGTGDTVTADRTTGYDTWTCEAIPSDGELEGTPVQASVTVSAANGCTALDYAVNDRVSVPRFTGQDLVGTDFTLEAWVNVDSGYIENQLPILFSDPQPDLSGWRFAVVGAPGARVLRFQLGGGLPNLPTISSVTLVPEDEWVHVAVTWEAATRDAKLFIDGIRVFETTMADDLLAGASSEDLAIGGSGSVGPYWMVGQLDEVRISTAVRYGPDFDPRIWFEPDADTLALWHLDDAVGPLAADAMGAHDGALSGAVWTSSSPCDLLP